MNKSQQLQALQLIFDQIHDGACVSDAEGIIIHFNEPYDWFLGVDSKEQIGKHINEVVENTRMHIVAKTGKAETNASQSIRGENTLVQRIPTKDNGKVIAAFGLVTFKKIKELGRLVTKISELESQVRLYQKNSLIRSVLPAMCPFGSLR